MASRIPAKGEVIRMVVDAKKPIHARELAAKLGVSAANVPKLVAAWTSSPSRSESSA